MRDERELDLPMQSIDCMVSQRLIESDDFSLDSQIMHAASSQPEPLGWPGSGFSRQPGTIAARRSQAAAAQRSYGALIVNPAYDRGYHPTPI